ncbi:amidohydrolase family protein [Pedobacter steynii]|uniref:2-pyrone-4,6-dicarboxylate hydrolase n=1 Tax=Pedobacter steynii TaxID=430522 RepID=A0A1D7QL03_9SPHI|nr:amidohydrolase family protein [Pedobacter steynii]AOM79361.1 2-pyrone-4,6-dicarboxylate hydrolase [Pedobacter steynii]
MKLFDSHFHIIDPKYPLVENNGYLPPDYTTDDYLQATAMYGITGGAIVSGSFQAFDQKYLINALDRLGKNFFGVANIPLDIDQEELERLQIANVVAVRFNVKRGGSEKMDHIEKLSNFVFKKFGWHTELYIDSKDLSNFKSVLHNIPKFSIDHLGLSKEGLDDLYYWVEKGVKVKATGFGRINFDPLPVMKTIYRINPAALMFGTDLPSTRAKVAFSIKDLQLLEKNFAPDELENIFYLNALNWYSKCNSKIY